MARQQYALLASPIELMVASDPSCCAAMSILLAAFARVNPLDAFTP
jgi:hypothetical protein